MLQNRRSQWSLTLLLPQLYLLKRAQLYEKEYLFFLIDFKLLEDTELLLVVTESQRPNRSYYGHLRHMLGNVT